MKCGVCGRYIAKASATFEGKPVGPVCGEKKGVLTVVKNATIKRTSKKSAKSIQRRGRFFDESNQLELFEHRT